MDINQRLRQKLDQRIEDGTIRTLNSTLDGIDFWSNDYLGSAKKSISNSNLTHGSTGSRLISGNSLQIEKLEADLAHFFDAESALLFNSGYDANVGLLSCLPQKNDVVLYDEHIHASVRDGIRLSLAKSYSFKHNSIEDLEKKIATTKPENGALFVCVESLYSMGGDFCPLLDLIETCEKHGAHLILDEAHSGGLYGLNGEGFAVSLDLHQRIFARLYTFGKAFGAHGAVVVGSDLLQQYLINFCRSLIYTTALSPAAVDAIRGNVFSEDSFERRTQLFHNCKMFHQLCQNLGIQTQSAINSPIQMLKVGDVKQTVAIANKLQANGFMVKAVVSPTVKPGDEALRVCLHTYNLPDEFNSILGLLSDSI